MTLQGSIHWGLFFKFRFSFSISASYDFNFLMYSCSENREKKRKNINLCEIDPSSFYAVISHCQCQSALERKICSCKKKITHSLGATQWTKIMKKVQFNVFFISSQSFFLVNKEIKKQDYFYRPIFIALFFPLQFKPCHIIKLLNISQCE